MLPAYSFFCYNANGWRGWVSGYLVMKTANAVLLSFLSNLSPLGFYSSKPDLGRDVLLHLIERRL